MQQLLTTSRNLLIVFSLLIAWPASAQDGDLLRAEDAFRYAVADTGSAIEIDWALEEGYYLYKNKLAFESLTPAVRLGDTGLPEGLHHEDEFFGVQQVYRDRFFVSIPYTVVGERPSDMQLEIRSQGCADLGICYPPQVWKAKVSLLASDDAPAKLDLGSDFTSGIGGANADFLPVDEAFQPILSALDGNTVELGIRVAPGYYLYKDKIATATDSQQVQLGRLDLPPGELKHDEWFGEMEVYHGDVFATLPVARATPESTQLSLAVSYQGCADGGICYPPVTRLLPVTLPLATAVSTLGALALAPAGTGGGMVSEQDRLAALISNAGILMVIATFFGAGLLLAFTPCVLPMVPILSGIIAGDGDNVSPARGFSLALSYVMGMALVYTAMPMT